ncbi:general substrate transporter [Clohesyomyces aquaticus]|uniref:General substrate transporter n=1 Tax=Clohesyomyces aquaticus TaxID=1231657 RepID=A0A1Y1ZRQ6_9PLEO|nr:general substrate transporter [Clohesyomyces aquaticus]
MQFPGIFKKPPGYVLASILCSFGGLLFGIDTGIIGPVTVMEDFTKYVGNPSPTIHGLIVSSILIPAAISSFFAGKLADNLGRHRGIAIGSFIFAVGAAIEAGSVHIGMFVAGRVIEGVGEGLYLGTLVVYVCEISPPRHRGVLATGPQLLITLGLVTGFFTCYGTTNMDSSFSWRLPFLLLACYSFAFSVIVLVWLPASPRWLTLRGRASEASAAWEKLGVPAADQEKILNELDTLVAVNTHVEIPEETRRQPATKNKAQILDVFSAETRPRLFLAVFLMGMQQLSGIDGVLYYAPILFQQAGLASNEARFLASGVSAIVIFAVTIPATIWADGWSRRASTVFGGLVMASLMFLIGSLYAGNAVHAATGAGRWVVIVSIYIFAAVFSVSWAVSIKIYCTEIQPQKTRATAASMAHGSNWLSNFLVALVTPTLLAKSSFGAYFLFGGCTFLTALVCMLFMPETRGKNLDEIEQSFHKSRLGGMGQIVGNLRKSMMRRRPAAIET